MVKELAKALICTKSKGARKSIETIKNAPQLQNFRKINDVQILINL